MTKLEEEISMAFQDKFTDHEMAIAAAEVAKKYIEKAIRDEQNRIWIYTSQRYVSGDQSLGAVVPMMHIARACNAIGETEKWLKENGVI